MCFSLSPLMDKVPVWRRSGLFSMWKLDYGWRKWSTLLLRLIRQRLKHHLPADLLASGAGGTCYERCLPMCSRVQMIALGNSFAAVDVTKRTRIWQLSRENCITLSLTKSSELVFLMFNFFTKRRFILAFSPPLFLLDIGGHLGFVWTSQLI